MKIYTVLHLQLECGVYLTEWIGPWGVWIIGLPATVAFFWGIRHFEGLEGLRPNKSLSKPTDGVTYGQAA